MDNTRAMHTPAEKNATLTQSPGLADRSIEIGYHRIILQ